MFSIKKKTTDGENNKTGVLARLRQGLEKTRSRMFAGVEEIFRRNQAVDDELLEEIETRLIMADLGIEPAARVLQSLQQARGRNQLQDYDQLLSALKACLVELLAPVEVPLTIPADHKQPFVILVVGVNGSGKTTTIGKLANFYQDQGKSVLLAAGDTFRAAAIEQIRHWGEQVKVPVIAQRTGADAAAVIYDALQSARANGRDLVIADTAGRLHNKDNLMQELAKIRRTIAKFDPETGVEVLLVLDAGTGQNALVQAKQFNEAVAISGVALTKLDGTAKGGVIFSIAHDLSLPVRFIGVGEQLDDLRPFHSAEFVDALLDIKT